MSKIGVVGATGMLGHHVAKQVHELEDHELVVIHRKTSNLETLKDLKYESRIADLNAQQGMIKAVKGLDYVLNCGAYYPTLPKPLKEEMHLAQTQMENFIAAIKEGGVQMGLYLGGAIAIPKSSDGQANENGVYTNMPPNKSAYVQVKWLMDKMAREAGQNGVPIVVGIPSMTFGEFDYGPSTGQLIVHTINQTIPGYVDGKRNVIYAGDAARGLLQACFQGKPGERYLITGENITMTQLIEEIARIGEVPVPKKVPLSLAKFISKVRLTKYKLFGGEFPVLNDTAIAVMSAGQYLDGRKAAEELKFAAEVSVKDALARTIQWFREVGYIQ